MVGQKELDRKCRSDTNKALKLVDSEFDEKRLTELYGKSWTQGYVAGIKDALTKYGIAKFEL